MGFSPNYSVFNGIDTIIIIIKKRPQTVLNPYLLRQHVGVKYKFTINYIFSDIWRFSVLVAIISCHQFTKTPKFH